jgi:hypothetical protein
MKLISVKDGLFLVNMKLHLVSPLRLRPDVGVLSRAETPIDLFPHFLIKPTDGPLLRGTPSVSPGYRQAGYTESFLSVPFSVMRQRIGGM